MRHVDGRVIDPNDDPHDWKDCLKDSRLPERYWAASTAKLLDPTFKVWAESTLENASTWLGKGYGFYIQGPFDTGKSSLAAIFLKEALRHNQDALWVPIRDVPGIRFRSTPALAAIDDKLPSTDLLVLDDLGSESFSLESAAGPALEAIVRIIYERKRSIIITSNVAWGDFPNAYAKSPGLVSVVTRITMPVALLRPWNSSPGNDMERPPSWN